MADKKDRTIGYRRARWLNDNPGAISLGMCIKQFAAKLKTVEERTIVRSSGQQVSVMNLKADSNGFFLHLAADTPGEYASVVPTAIQTVEEVDVAIAPPPDDGEWMDSDAFLYVKNNDVCLCSTGMRDGGIQNVLRDLFKKAELRRDSTSFELIKWADVSKTKIIREQGIERIDLHAAVYKATANYQRRKTQTYGLLGGLARQIKSMLNKDNDVTEDALTVSLTLKVDKRKKKGIVLGEKRLETLALDLIKNEESDDEFTIVTKTGQKISASEIYMRRSVKLDSVAKSVDRESAWKELRTFYRYLEQTGALEQ